MIDGFRKKTTFAIINKPFASSVPSSQRKLETLNLRFRLLLSLFFLYNGVSDAVTIQTYNISSCCIVYWFHGRRFWLMYWVLKIMSWWIIHISNNLGRNTTSKKMILHCCFRLETEIGDTLFLLLLFYLYHQDDGNRKNEWIFRT